MRNRRRQVPAVSGKDGIIMFTLARGDSIIHQNKTGVKRFLNQFILDLWVDAKTKQMRYSQAAKGASYTEQLRLRGMACKHGRIAQTVALMIMERTK